MWHHGAPHRASASPVPSLMTGARSVQHSSVAVRSAVPAALRSELWASAGCVEPARPTRISRRSTRPPPVTRSQLHKRMRWTAVPRYSENERVHSGGWMLAAVWSSMPRRPPTGRPARARFLAKTLR